MRQITHTLMLPFERGLLPPPQPGRRHAFLNAVPLPGVTWSDGLVCEQPLRPDWLALQAAGLAAVPELDEPPGSLAGVLMLIGRSRRRNEIDLRRAWEMTEPGGHITVAGAKTDGIGSLRKWAADHTRIADSLAKHHGRVFWLAREAAENPFPPLPSEGPAAPGMFSADGADPGSVMLAAQFDADIGGSVADFGAGWGYLGVQLLAAGARPQRLDCFEADWRALQSCKRNLAQMAAGLESSFHWHDIAREPIERRYDWIVMNPPFHAGRAAEPRLGQAFIAAAAAALKPGGRLLMVANRNLPYERSLGEHFASFTRLREEKGYKVLLARR